MRNQVHFGSFLAVAILLVCPCAGAQGTPDSSAANTQQAAQKTPAKPHKTWTDDDVSSLRTPADNYVREKEEQAAAAAAKRAEEVQAAKQQAAANSGAQNGAPSPLSNPKSVADADRMIAWEQRDLDSQQEAVERTKQEIAAAATPEERAQKQKALDHYIECVERIKQEKQGLEKNRSALQKKAKEKEQVESAGMQTDTP